MESDEILNGNAQAPPDLSAAIGKLMAHPEILQMAASVLQGEGNADSAPTEAADTVSPERGVETTDATADSTTDAVSQALPDLLRIAGPLLSHTRGGERHVGNTSGLARSTALLLALKPYLSPRRCDTVDKIVQMSKLGTLFEQLRG